ncbi:MAG: AmmeMemoRadiSam system protein B [Calditrichaeota bacterium]|nr:AmmeMemoRadiSam system protein B [Calditrichota bacterium]
MTIKRTSFAEKKTFDLDYKPKMKYNIEAVPAKTDDGTLLYGLKDIVDQSAELLWLPQDLFYLLQFFDGRHSRADIKAEYMRKFGDFLFDENYVQLLQSLNEYYFLNNDRSRMRTRKMTIAYRQLPHRTPTSAGSSYPSDPDALADMLDTLVNLVTKKRNGAAINLDGRAIKAMVVPHIEIRLGGTTYAHAYRLLAHSSPADLYVILGIGHQGIPNLFSLTSQDFETPLGIVRTDKSLVEEISVRSDFDFLKNELVHRDEHSIEFQTIFLKHFVKSDFKILPVLCSFSHSIFARPKSAAFEKFKAFVRVLKSTLSRYPGTVTIIASVDFSHVGTKYGDLRPPSPPFLAQVERSDRDVIDALIQFDQQQFQQRVFASDNQYRICGYSALTTMLELVSPSHSYFLDYNSAVMDEQRSRVTFASLIFT